MRRGSPLLDGCTLRQKRQAPSISAGPGRRSSSPGSLERATTPGGRKPALRVGRAAPGRRQWETSRAALRSGTPHQRDAQPDRAAHVSTTRRLRRLPSGPPHRVASSIAIRWHQDWRRPLLQPSIFVTAAAVLRVRRPCAGLLVDRVGKKGRPSPVRGSYRRLLRQYGVRRKLGRCHLRRQPRSRTVTSELCFLDASHHLHR
jgi:hypothetical protein